METRLLFVHALSPLHPGTGQGTGVIDLPIAREKSTGIPYLPGSSLKGVLRDRCSDEPIRTVLFGPDRIAANSEAAAGALQLTDQRLLLFPVRSIAGTFAWVTSPYIWHRFARDARDIGVSIPTLPVNAYPTFTNILTASETALVATGQTVYLEDLDLQCTTDVAAKARVTEWGTWVAGQLFPGEDTTFLTKRLAIVHDDVMTFLLTNATEVIARIKLQEDMKTVQQGGLWYEEALPSESILSGLVIANTTPSQVHIVNELEKLIRQTMQLGGKSTIGRGLCRVTLSTEGTK